MDGQHWNKCCSDTKLETRDFTPAHFDLVFTKIKTKRARKITCSASIRAGTLAAVAQLKAEPLKDIVQGLLWHNTAPSSSGTNAKKNKSHDDPNMYTGVHARGGPTHGDKRRALEGAGGSGKQESIPAFQCTSSCWPQK
jgi:hypothetical protein